MPEKEEECVRRGCIINIGSSPGNKIEGTNHPMEEVCLFSSRLLIGLIIPLVILGLAVWFTASAEINRSSVRVAGALVGQADVDLSVRECFIQEGYPKRNLTVALEAYNRGGLEVNMDPRLFRVVLSHSSDPLGESRPQGIYTPLRYWSQCQQAPSSLTLIPAGARRSYTLVFWGHNLPRGEEWKDYLLSLEYYDPASSLMASKLLKPEER